MAPSPQRATRDSDEQSVKVAAGPVVLDGELRVPRGAHGIVLFAHGSGSSRFSARNQYVADTLGQAGLATLLFDLLTPLEESIDIDTGQYRFNINLLAERVAGATDWLKQYPKTRELSIGYFGASTGAAAALVAASERPDDVAAIVSRGGRPDLAGPALTRVRAPTLLIVGENDVPVIQLNQEAAARMPGAVQFMIVPRATHLFEEPGALEEVARLAGEWFLRHLGSSSQPAHMVDEQFGEEHR